MIIVFAEDDEMHSSDQSGSSRGGTERSWSEVRGHAGRAIEEIDGVVSARVEGKREGKVEEVHVVARSDRKAKEIVRDVETLLKARFDLAIDHRKISVARVGEVPELATEAGAAPRVSFKGVSLHLSRDGGEAEVELMRSGQRWIGRASSRGPESAWPRLVAEAALDAVAQMLPADSYLELSDLVPTVVAERETVLVSVNFRRHSQSLQLVGCARVEGDMQRSVVYAALHALNRFLGRFSQGAQRELILEPPWDS
jgi:hypothetical protein